MTFYDFPPSFLLDRPIQIGKTSVTLAILQMVQAVLENVVVFGVIEKSIDYDDIVPQAIQPLIRP
jgi:hypothetical protein